MAKRLDIEPGDLIFFVADHPKVANEALGHLRNLLGKKLNLINEDKFSFVWITRFPLLEYDEDEGRYQALHHPFTAPLKKITPCSKMSPWQSGPVRMTLC